ncbi:MAG: hypothetical protein WC728_15720 [Elusimicrobiota bacterium]
MSGAPLLLAAALTLPTTANLQWDGDMERLELPSETVKPMRLPYIQEREESRPDPRAGRRMRRITGRPTLPIAPGCPDGSDPPCLQETPYPSGMPKGGYYYGYYRGEDGKLRYGKLYIPNYGPFEGGAHNNPPERTSVPKP